MKKITLLLLVALPLLALKCKWEPTPKPEVMPEATHQGLRTWGMYVNGELWVAKSKPTFNAEAGYWNEGLAVSANRKVDSLFQSIKLFIPQGKFTGPGTYELRQYRADSSNYCLFVDYTGPGDISYGSSDSMPNYLVITHFDFENRIVAGTFNVSVVSEDGQDTLHCTDGRFDLPL